jgi:hypothetical protein
MIEHQPMAVLAHRRLSTKTCGATSVFNSMTTRTTPGLKRPARSSLM